jgi:hypothetical protein
MELNMGSKELKKDILLVSGVINNFEIGLNNLRGLQRPILELYYWGEQRTWVEVVNALKTEGKFVGISHAKRIREQAIKRIAGTAKITIESYKEVIEIIEGKDNE